MQVFLGKSDSTDSNKQGSPCLMKKSVMDPTMCSTPNANSNTNKSPMGSCSILDTSRNCSLDEDVDVIESSCSANAEHTVEILPEESNGSSPEEVNDLGKFQAIK